MERHQCKLCSKSFSNGRALGGHMRSHLFNLPNPSKQEQELPIVYGEETESASSSSSSSSEEEAEAEQGGRGEGEEEKDEEEEEEEEEDKGGFYYGLRENPKRSIRLVDPEFSFSVDAAYVVLQDRESETESSKNPTRRRSKRSRRLIEKNHQHHQKQRQELENNTKKLNCHKHSNKTESSWAEPEPVSSISDTTSEEDVAFCLMMLSRDKWKRKEQHSHHQEQEGEEEEAEADKFEEETDESDEFKACRTRIRGKYRCETCNKVFKSYQALGGHRASHKKLKVITPPKGPNLGPQNAATSSSILAEKRIHECPYCFRVFSSGQALGGHKRSHLTGLAASSAAGSSAKFGDNLKLIDLNLPAPVEDDDVSQIELSAVSDAEFVMYIKR